jgi:hypothetical protein
MNLDVEMTKDRDQRLKPGSSGRNPILPSAEIQECTVVVRTIQFVANAAKS